MNINSGIKFTRLLMIVFLSIVMLSIISGCGGTPQYVVSKFFHHISTGDTVSAKKYCTKNFLDKYGQSFDTSSQFMQYFKTQFGDKTTEKKEYIKENFQCEISGKTARVWEKEFPGFVMICAKERGFWKVDDFSFDFAEMLKSLNIKDLKDLQNLTPEKLKDLGRGK